MFRASVRKNVAMGLIYRDVPKQEREQRVLEALRSVGMEHLAKRNARTLSGGETKRVAVARALAISPDILLLDEPTANVDGTNAGRIEQIIRHINESAGMTIIFSTHNLNQAYRLSHEVVTLMYGKAQGTSLVNIFSGIAHKENGEPVFDTGRARIKLPVFDGDVRQISVDPNDIIISRQPVSSSARNHFSGQIIEMIRDGRAVTVTVRADEDFRVTVTERSVREMGLFIGEDVSITFKASSVTMYQPAGTAVRKGFLQLTAAGEFEAILSRCDRRTATRGRYRRPMPSEGCPPPILSRRGTSPSFAGPPSTALRS